MASPPTPARKYIPATEDLNQEFFLQCAGGALHLQRCSDCGAWRHPPRYYCPVCFSDGWAWEPSTGAGKVASWVTTHYTVDRGWVDEVPYTNVVVQLDEGPRLLGGLRGMDADDLELGMEVVIVGETKRDDFVFFWVEPVNPWSGS
ncbi:MAG: hypothetical protein GY724_12455 [Actinomycetia bacterium]|nr:hypothetical protein [Actinomycetes bacterium]MCP4225709.1 hypothetical protein [Actinomycetes bacterium]MCP5034515.1 hypothetical protein [Actinomycetes bacterium]